MNGILIDWAYDAVMLLAVGLLIYDRFRISAELDRIISLHIATLIELKNCMEKGHNQNENR